MIDADNIEGHKTPARRRWLFAAFAALFLAAQLIFAAHVGAPADALSNHAPDTCAVCMASASAPDPVSLVVAVSAPFISFSAVEFAVQRAEERDGERVRANSRGPPLA